jgi:hypothetical protein
MPLDWFAEPFQPYGSFAGEGALRVLGKPQLDPLAVLVRETGQNTWDARRDDSSTVTFSVSGWTVSAEQRTALQEEVFAVGPPDGLSLAAMLEMDGLNVLCISDRGTRGLSGPTRADQPATGRTDFTDYVFNMGQPRDIEGGGGTYGFGKTITYVVSRASAVVVHTRTRTEHGLESRLIGIAVGSQYDDHERRFTGRHWWGITDGSVVQPVHGSAADALGARLGLQGFSGDATGTDIMIIAPDFGGRTPRQGVTFMAHAALWHFWPKMIVTAGQPVPMRFAFGWQGEQIALRPIAAYPPLNAFARAFQGVKAFQSGEPVGDDVVIRPVEAQRPRRRLGALGIVRMPRLLRVPLDATADEPEEGEEARSPAAFAGNSHHVALMRQVNLVVNYRPGPELPMGDVEWAGVFINEPDIDVAFAEAEPPTHDEWTPAMIPDKIQRRLVNLALRNIDSELKVEFGVAHPPIEPDAVRSVVVVADALGGLLAGSHGIGPRQQDSAAPAQERHGTSGVRGPTFADVNSRLVLFRGEPCTETRFRVRPIDGLPVRVSADVSVAIDGSMVERDPPLGSAIPSVIGWGKVTDLEQGRLDEAAEITIPPGDDQLWALVVRNPPSAAVSINLTAKAVR